MVGPQDTRSFLEDYLDIIRKSIAFVARRVSRNIVACLLIIILFGAAGFGLWHKQTPYYESELVALYNNKAVPRKTYGEMLHKLDLLAQNKSGQQLGRILGMSPELGNSILRVEAKNQSGSPLHEDITDQYQAIYITVRSTNRAAFQPTEQGLLTYLCSSPYQRMISKMAAERVAMKIDMLYTDMRKTDSIIDAYTVSLRNGVPLQDSIGERYNIQVLFDHKSGLEDNLLDHKLKLGLESGPGVSIVHGFASADRPTRGSKKPILAMIILGMAVALCWAILKNDKKTINA